LKRIFDALATLARLARSASAVMLAASRLLVFIRLRFWVIMMFSIYLASCGGGGGAASSVDFGFIDGYLTD
jgi:hypothetical protein